MKFSNITGSPIYGELSRKVYSIGKSKADADSWRNKRVRRERKGKRRRREEEKSRRKQ